VNDPGGGPLPVLYLDDDLVAVEKPAGLAVHRGWAAERDVALTRVRDQLGCYLHPVHRLDRGASGVLLFARNAAAARALGDDFAAGRIGKRYLALVRGVPPERVTVDHPVPSGEERDSPRVAAVTEIERLEVIGRYSLVAARPLTGRLHQIRRHLKHLACPILGDVNYGKGDHNRACRDRYGLHRLFLHATELSLIQPTTGASLVLRSPLAAELDVALGAMRAVPPR
jgi:tRNA pseudouridine65 synthase